MTKPGIAMLAALLVALPVCAAEPADGVALSPGEKVELRLAAGGDPGSIVRGEAGTLSEFDRAAVAALTGGAYGYPVGPNVAVIKSSELDIPAPAPVATGIARIVFVQLKGGSESLLLIENGYGSGLAYRARIQRGGKAEPTDVCQAMPLKRAYEHWPYPIETIILSNFRLVPWKEGQRPTCE